MLHPGKTTAVAGVVARIMKEAPTQAAKDDGNENPQLNLGRGKKFSVRRTDMNILSKAAHLFLLVV